MLAMTVSNIGYWMQTVAVAYLMRLWTNGDPVMVSLVQTALFVPPALLLLPAGALVDRLDRRKFMIFSQTWMMLAATALTILVLAEVQSPWGLIALLALFAVGFALNTPSQSSIWPELVGLKEVPQAIGIYSLTNNGARLVGPAIAGALTPVFGAVSVIAFNALSYVGVIAVLSYWKREAITQPKAAQSFWLSLFGGIAFARQSMPYRATLMRGGIFFIVASIVLAILPVKVSEAHDFGTVFSFFGLGAILGALSYARVAHRFTRAGIVRTVIGVNALALIGIGFAASVVSLCGLLLVVGFTWFFVMSSVQIGAQMILPDEVRGRGLALLNLVLMGGYAVGSPLWGTTAHLTSPDQAFMIAGVVSLLALAMTNHLKLPVDKSH